MDGEVYYEDTVVDVAYRDYEIRDLLALEREHGQTLDGIRTLFRQNRMVSSIAGDLDHKSVLRGADGRGGRRAGLQRRRAPALPPPHPVDAHGHAARDHDARRPRGPAEVHPQAPRGARAEAEPLVRRHGRAPRRRDVAGRVGAAARRSAREGSRSLRVLGRAVRRDAAGASLPGARRTAAATTSRSTP